jgi:polyhydroxyalkanoate synthesis regulator phasin
MLMTETKIARMLRELQSDMADLVASGDLTAEQANEWVNCKADQWNAESQAEVRA